MPGVHGCLPPPSPTRVLVATATRGTRGTRAAPAAPGDDDDGSEPPLLRALSNFECSPRHQPGQPPQPLHHPRRGWGRHYLRSMPAVPEMWPCESCHHGRNRTKEETESHHNVQVHRPPAHHNHSSWARRTGSGSRTMLPPHGRRCPVGSRRRGNSGLYSIRTADRTAAGGTVPRRAQRLCAAAGRARRIGGMRHGMAGCCGMVGHQRAADRLATGQHTES
jgi:hypothetical protein